MASSLPGRAFRWSPRGAADCLVTGTPGDEMFTGLMQALQNLVPDPTTNNLWVPRPASLQKTNFTGFTTPGFVSGLLVIGTRAYGMIASGRNAGKDEPFVYDIAGGNFIAVSGVTAGNSPTSPPTTGTWQPPILALVGQYVVVCHSGFDGVSNFVGWIDITNFNSPAWSAGNVATNPLPSPAVAVAQFNGRAYYLCNPPNANPSAQISDSLDPKTRTQAGNILTFGDNVPLVAAAGLPLTNQLGGIIQSLMVFKASNVYQITGDPSSSNLSVNTLNTAMGTSSPLSIAPTPNGLAFVSQDGLRIIDFEAHISDPIGLAGTGVTNPFLQALVPSRTAAACNATVIRIRVQNSAVTGNPVQDWWYDVIRKVWSGPHTFPGSLAQPYGTSFIIAPEGVTASLWQSDNIPTSSSTYTENGVAMNFSYQTSLMPDSGEMATLNIIESDLWAAFGSASNTFTVAAYDENGFGLDTCQLMGNVVVGGTWGVSVWGQFVWGGSGAALSPRRLKWTRPLTFTRLSIQVVGQCAAGVRLGDFFARVEELNYIPNQ